MIDGSGFEEVFNKYKLDRDERKVYYLMKQYENISRGKKKYITLFKKDTDPREAKYWGAFAKYYITYETRRVDNALFFAAQIELWNEKGKSFVPNFLSSDLSWKRYKKYINIYKNKIDVEYSSQKEVAKSIYLSHKFIQKWLKENGMAEDNYKAFFSYKEEYEDYMPACYKFISNSVVNRMYLCISASFGEVQEDYDRDIKDELITEEELRKNRNYILTNEIVRQYAMRTLGEEFDMSWKY